MAGMEAFEAYFRRADLNQDGRISGQEAVAFFQGASLPQQVLAQVWMHADQSKTGFLGRPEFFNALRLVTVAQSGRQLTPDIVQSALYGPAAARIPPPKIAGGPAPPQTAAPGAPRPQGNAAAKAPAPAQAGATQMNPAAAAPRPQGSGMIPTSTQFAGAPQANAGAVPRPQGVNSMMPPATQGAAMPPNQFTGPRGTQSQPPNMGFNQQPLPSSTGFMRPPQVGAPPTSLQATGMNQSPLGGGSMGGSVGWQGGNVGSLGGISQPSPGAAFPSQATSGGFGPASSSPMGMPPGQHAHAMSSSSLPPQSNSAVLPQDSRALVPSGNGPASGSGASTDIFSALTQPKPSTSTPPLSTGTMPNSSSFMSMPTGSQNLANLTQPGSLQGTPAVSYGSNQPQQTQPITKPSVPAPGVSAGVSNSTSQWPNVNQSDIQKYTKVFGDVDRDRDGKITGAEARTLFLSWRLPRDVLKQVWDLSDQDNDGMLSLREFCIALYLMERNRAGTPLPPSLPDSLKFDETLLRATGLPSTAYNAPSWQHNQGLPHKGPGAPGLPTGGVRPPLPHMHSQTDGATRPGQPRPHMPGMDNHAAVQGSKDDRSGVNSAAQEPPKKVEVEKQVLDSREKLEYYRTKMQDLVLYKSRCDNRLNEITERASSDKREVELLSKKYEEKYKQVAELASKLAVDEAAFRDVQERKVELNDALIKMVQGGSVDGLLQVRADRIQHQLEEMEKAFSERCKHFGLQFKPSATVELPFGWEPVQQEGAVEWDEDWDKFEDEGFGLVKDNGTIVENPASAENAKSSLWDDGVSTDGMSPVASSNGHIKDVRHYRAGDQAPESELAYDFGDESVRSPGSAGRSASGSPFKSSRFGGHDSSPTKKGTYSDHGGSESVFGDNYGDETTWNFDDQDTESVWGSNAMNEPGHHGSNSFFGSDGFNVDPVRVGSPSGASAYGKKSTFFDDSVPSSPAYTSGFSPKFGESRDDSSSYNFGRFDSFRSQDSVVPQESRFSRFDSISSSKGEGAAGFDSSNSSRNFGRFDSFDEADPFGSTGPFKASGARSPPKF